MREIKFRIWNENIKKMSIGSPEIFSWETIYAFNKKAGNEKFYAIMQFTGLKDKNGKNVYEGDIVARYWSDGSILQQFEVKWFDDKAGYNINPALLSSRRYNKQTQMSAHGFEIIGNIYETPELLNAQ